MSKKRNILMCLQQLEIGGVETAVVTLCLGYKRKGYNVYVAAKNGIFSEKLKQNGIEVFDIEYEFLNRYPLDKKNELIEFCKEKEITEIHIHQYPCVLYWLPVCLELKIPYVAYVHSIVPGAPEWFLKTFKVHRTALPIFFENASKVICIAESTKNEIDSIFHLDSNKYKIIPNSLNLEEFKTNKTIKEIKTFGILSRFSEEKLVSIKKSIDFFEEYAKNSKEARLLIAGDGPAKKELENYTRNIKNVKFIGAISNASEFMEKIDVFMGVDRCILEAICSKRLALISSYNGMINIVNKDNIDLLSKENFSGVNIDKNNISTEELKTRNIKEYKQIIEDNFEYINKKYNVDNNLYMDKLNNEFTCEYIELFNQINKLLDEIDNLSSNKNISKDSLLVKVKKLLRKVYSKIKH